MQVLILGIGDAFTSRSFGASALIRAPGGLILLDCGDAARRALREATESAGWKVEAAEIHDILLTHLHGDHCNGLEAFGFYRRVQRLRDPSLPIPRLHTTQPVADRLWDRLAPAMEKPFGGEQPSILSDYFDIRILTPGMTSTVAGLAVQCRFTGHPIPTIGLRLSDGIATFGWSGDTPFEAEHLEWLSVAQLIVHEANVGPAHTPIEALNALPDELRARMRLIHLPDDFDPATTTLVPLWQGEVLTVGDRNPRRA